jgi:hypothetical protein
MYIGLLDHQINTLMMIKARFASNWPSVYSRDLQFFLGELIFANSTKIKNFMENSKYI